MRKPQEFCESKESRANRIDTLLRHLIIRQASLTEPGDEYTPLSLREIAEFCGTDEMVIYRAEQSALKKFQSKIPQFSLYLGLDGKT